jgi:hypothetical protein
MTAENPTAVDPAPTSGAPTQAADPATNDPAAQTPGGAQTPSQTTPPPAAQPTAQRTGIDRSRGGWTIVVTSQLQREEAAQIADEFAQIFQALRFPIDILTTDEFTQTRHRVGIGQFASRQEANAILEKFQSELPSDAWLLRIE